MFLYASSAPTKTTRCASGTGIVGGVANAVEVAVGREARRGGGTAGALDDGRGERRERPGRVRVADAGRAPSRRRAERARFATASRSLA